MSICLSSIFGLQMFISPGDTSVDRSPCRRQLIAW